MKYQEFLQSRRHIAQDYGIEPNWMPDMAFDYQKFVIERSLRKGRYANFLDTGTGKTLIELTHAVNYSAHTKKPVLIITPLAVAFQFIKEAAKFGISDIEYSKDGRHSASIVVCNYERLEKFKASDFDCVILDESSILKNFEGATKQTITDFLRKVQYRYLFTATPSPNDFVELGTSSEALGNLGYMDMLSKFFKNNQDNSIDPAKIGVEWVLKGHARDDFFKWVSTWSISMRKPSDVGPFDDSKHILPPLTVRYNEITNDQPLIVNGQAQLFAQVARSQSEVRAEGKVTTQKRCEKAAELAAMHDTSVYWCNTNIEADIIEKADKEAMQIKGPMSIEQKEEILLAFANGELKKLVTKPTITAFGLNWQHCNHTVYFPTFSYEQYYQAIRRFWRFGQQSEVFVDLVYSDGQKRLIDAILAKTKKADELYTKLNSALNQSFEVKKTEFNQQIIKPSFI